MRITTKLALAFINRSKALGFKGKTRDKAALEYVQGALALASVNSDNYSESLVQSLDVMMFLVSVRGFSEIESYAKIEDDKEVTPA